jgi:hypothetical protein
MAAGQSAEAIDAAEQALELATASGQDTLAATIRNRLKSFRAAAERAASAASPTPAD